MEDTTENVSFSDFADSDLELHNANHIQGDFSFKQVGSIAHYVEPVNGSLPIDTAVEMFQTSPELTALPVEEYDRVIGILERKSVEDAMSSVWKRFTSGNVIDYVIRTDTVLQARDYIEKTLQKVSEINRKSGIFYFSVFANHSFYGIVALDSFLSRISEIREQDLEKAAAIQQGLFPSAETLDALPFSIFSWNKMANALGGDFYQCFQLSAKQYLVSCFDVSGKNVAASLLTIAIGTFFNTIKTMNAFPDRPEKLLQLLDHFLETTVPVGSFITAAICCIDIEKNSVQVFNCGHTTVYLFAKDSINSNCIKLASVNPLLPPLGMGAVADNLKTSENQSANLYSRTAAIKSGMHIELYSDGFTDMKNEDDIRFNEDRTKKFFIDLYKDKNDVVLKSVTKVVNDWTQSAMLPDDITVIDIRF